MANNKTREKKEPLVRMVQRQGMSTQKKWIIRIVSIVVALILGGFIFMALGYSPFSIYGAMIDGSLGGKLAIDLPSIAEKKAYIVQQLTQETWETELRIEMPHKHYVNMTPAVAECRSKMYAELHGGKV